MKPCTMLTPHHPSVSCETFPEPSAQPCNMAYQTFIQLRENKLGPMCQWHVATSSASNVESILDGGSFRQMFCRPDFEAKSRLSHKCWPVMAFDSAWGPGSQSQAHWAMVFDAGAIVSNPDVGHTWRANFNPYMDAVGCHYPTMTPIC